KALNINSRDYVLVASTHNTEELQIYNVWKTLNRSELLIIAPRHPERRHVIIKQINCDNLAVRSKNDRVTEQTKVYLLDTIGELKDYFSDAQLVIMGGSFVPIGGHNILEPASFNCAIITGPHMENFQEELELLLTNEAILQVTTMPELSNTLSSLLENKTRKTTLINNTKKLSLKAKDILNNYTKLIVPEHISRPK
ncbi:MAG: 3-deoxy-D-manno-octulosonic acid transferase, partial [Gammaproteobacteria bacterium]|nr:3-deoxy-D-manno-octulosonic acid transferase [Gammaproteobacteria bacterium]